MKDSELRGLVLKFLYDNRRQDFIAFGRIQEAVPIPDEIDIKDWLRACSQLADYNLIDWNPFEDHTGQGLLGGVAKINGFGTDVVEGEARSPISLVIDQSQHIEITGSQGVQIAGAYSTQQQNISDAFEKVIAAIDGATVSDSEKKKARSLLVKLLESKAANALLGIGARALIDKYLNR